MKTLRLLGATILIGAVAAAALWSFRVFQYPTAMTPTLLQLSTGVSGGRWGSVGPSAPLTFFVLPLREPAMGVQLILNAPHPSTLTMTAVDPATTALTVLAEISPGVPEPATGFFRVDRVDTSSSPPRWFVTVRAPATFESVPITRYTIGVTNVSNNPFLSGTARTSAPLVVTIATRPDFTITVRIDGPGHVTSTPSGIHCPTSCQSNFQPPASGPGPVPVTLTPGSDQGARFLGWSGACSGRNVCNLVLSGAAAFAVAHFGPVEQADIAICPAPLIAGWTWRDRPVCTRPERATRSARCDSQGYFCCDPGVPADPRCPGTIDTRLTPADCGINTDQGTRRMLFQPGGCYETTSGP